jgi:hypothetical protein
METVQHCSLTILHDAGKDLGINKPEAQDNISLLLQAFDSVSNLCEELSRLAYVLQTQNKSINRKGEKE